MDKFYSRQFSSEAKLLGSAYAGLPFLQSRTCSWRLAQVAAPGTMHLWSTAVESICRFNTNTLIIRRLLLSFHCDLFLHLTLAPAFTGF